MGSVTEITDNDAFKSLLQTPSPVKVLYFHAPWARPCIQMSQALVAIASSHAPRPLESRPLFLSINAEDQTDIAEEYNVASVPFVVFLGADGKQVDSFGGADAKRLDATVKALLGEDPAKERAGIPPAQEVAAPVPSNGHEGHDHSEDEDDSEEEDLPLDERLSKLINAAPVMIFIKGTPSAPQCGFSRKLIALLRERRVRFGFFNILADEEVRQGLKAFSDWPTYPQVYRNGQLVGGLDIVKEELEADPEFFEHE